MIASWVTNQHVHLSIVWVSKEIMSNFVVARIRTYDIRMICTHTLPLYHSSSLIQRVKNKRNQHKILCTFTLKFIFMVMVLIMVMIMVIAFLFIIITIVIWIMDFEVMNGCISCYKHKQMHFKSTNDKNYLYNYTWV